MKIHQQILHLRPKNRGFHLITHEIMQDFPFVSAINTGMMQVFMMHTSAGLTLNENADPTVRQDFEMYFNKLVPENDRDYKHTDEGPDDMPAHLKAALVGNAVMIPIRHGKLVLGIWQGIYQCEFRDNAAQRTVCITAWGEENTSQ